MTRISVSANLRNIMTLFESKSQLSEKVGVRFESDIFDFSLE